MEEMDLVSTFLSIGFRISSTLFSLRVYRIIYIDSVILSLNVINSLSMYILIVKKNCRGSTREEKRRLDTVETVKMWM